LLRMPLEGYVVRFMELVVAPFQNLGRVWLGIIPLYVSLILGELYISKVTFGHAVRNGFVILWAAMSWAVHLAHASKFSYIFSSSTKIIAWIVTACCLAIGVFTVVLGVRKKDRELAAVLGHTRFSGYFLIMIYPMQAGLIRWDWQYVSAVLVLALPAWFLIYLMGCLGRMAVK
jgi:hypothetical protein